uniref:Uncharacterized protein n=1 Tax=Tanacetum cinerariifolium TaxID=118510 RepID=A0A6L2JTM9_TANCI|nr:hypothetical protein [Tanacetum cinerariifolium]
MIKTHFDAISERVGGIFERGTDKTRMIEKQREQMGKHVAKIATDFKPLLKKKRNTLRLKEYTNTKHHWWDKTSLETSKGRKETFDVDKETWNKSRKGLKEYCGIRFGEEQATTTTTKLTNQFSVWENNIKWSAQNGTTPTFGLEEDRHKMEDSFVGKAFEDQQKKEDKNTGTSTVEDFDLDKYIGKYLMT